MSLRLSCPLLNVETDAGSGGGSAPGAHVYGSSQQESVPPAPGAAPAWSWADADGRLSSGWLEKLGPELAGRGSLKSIQTIGDLAKSYHATKALVGRKLEMPAADAPPERWAEWRKVTGAPERPEGYRGEARSLRPEVLPEDGWDMEAENKFLGIAHKHGLPPAAVKEIMGFYGDTLAGGLRQMESDEAAMIQMESTKLRQEWGRDFDANLASAARMARLAGLDPATHPIFTRSDVVKGFAGLSRLIAGDSAVKGDQQGLGVPVAERVRDITDPRSSSMLAREYRGEYGADRQAAAQQTLHQLMSTR